MNPQVMACSIRAVAKGNLPGKPVGDPRQMPGLFYALQGAILWQHDYAHAGDSPEWAALPERLPRPVPQPA